MLGAEGAHGADVVKEAQPDQFGMEGEIAHGLEILEAAELVESDVDVGVTTAVRNDVVDRETAELLAPHPLIMSKEWPEIRGPVENEGAGLVQVIPVAAAGEDR